MQVDKNIVANYFGQGWSALVQLAFIPVYIRYLGAESYGLISLYAILLAFLAILDLGLTPTVNREMARFRARAHSGESIHDLLRSLEVIGIGIGLLIAVVVILTSGFTARHWLVLEKLDTHTVAGAIAIMGVAGALRSVENIYQGAVLGLQHQVWLSAFTAVSVTARALGSIATLVFVAPSVSAFLWFQCLAGLVQMLTLAWYVHRKLPAVSRPPRFSIDAVRGVWSFAASLTIISILSLILMQADKVLLARLLPLSEFGYLSLGITLTGALSLAILPVFNAAYPRLSALAAAGDAEMFSSEYHRLSQLLALTVLPAALVMACFSRSIVMLWTGDPVATDFVSPIVSVWVLGTAFNGLMHMPYAAQLAHGWSRLTITVNCVAVVLMIPAVLYFVPRHGAIAAAWIWFAINAGYLLVVVPSMHRRVVRNGMWRWYVHDVGQPALAAVAVVAIMYLYQITRPAMSTSGQLAFLALGFVGAVLCAAASTRAGRDTLVGLAMPHATGTKS